MTERICDGEFAGPAACVCGHWERHVEFSDEMVAKAADALAPLLKRELSLGWNAEVQAYGIWRAEHGWVIDQFWESVEEAGRNVGAVMALLALTTAFQDNDRPEEDG